MPGPLSLRNALAQGPSPTAAELRDMLQSPYLSKGRRKRYNDRLDLLERDDERARRDRSEERQDKSYQLQIKGDKRAEESHRSRMDVLAEKKAAEEARLKAERDKQKGLSMWNPEKGMGYPLSSVLSGADKSLQKIPAAHANYLQWGRDIARGVALSNAPPDKGWGEAYAARHNATLETLYDKYLATVEVGGEIHPGVMPKQWQREPGPLRHSLFGNPFKSGGVDEGGFMSVAAKETGLPPLVVGSWLRHKLSDKSSSGRGFLPEEVERAEYLDKPREDDSPFSRANYDRFYKETLRQRSKDRSPYSNELRGGSPW